MNVEANEGRLMQGGRGGGLPGARPLRIAVYAPHLSQPIRNGCDQYIWHKWGALDPARHRVTLFAADGTYRLETAGWEATRKVKPTMRSRAAAVATALVRASDYLSAKFSTPAYLDHARADDPGFDLRVYSYVSTYVHLSGAFSADGAGLVETHNYDPKFYLDRGLEARGPMRVAAWIAAGRAHELLANVPKEVALVALGEADAGIFRALGFETVLLSALGYEEQPPRTRFASPGRLTISFVGSLSASMNSAAIRRFAFDELPRLRSELPAGLEVHVAGSNPSPSLTADLRGCGITVHADLPDAALHELVDRSHATILPFDSSNGLKLKFALSASRGVPILSFIQAPPEFAQARGVLVSRDMGDWAVFLAALDAIGAQQRAALELQGIARDRSWRAAAESSLQALGLHRA